MSKILYICHNQRNSHCNYDKVQKTTDCSHERAAGIHGEDNPEGFSRWTLRLISERAVEMQIIDAISHTQVGRILKKTNISLI